MLRAVLKFDVALHWFGGFWLGFAASLLPWQTQGAFVVLIYMLGEARETLQKIESGDYKAFGLKRRIEALAWPVGAVFGLLVGTMQQ